MIFFKFKFQNLYWFQNIYINSFCNKKKIFFLLNTRKKGKVSCNFWFYMCFKIISCIKMLFFMPIFTQFMLVSPFETRLHSVRLGCYLNVTLCNGKLNILAHLPHIILQVKASKVNKKMSDNKRHIYFLSCYIHY